jgi:hypothetical protein
MEFKIRISDMRLAVNRILDHIENDLGHEFVTFDQDSYWDVADNERYEFSRVPENFGHGQLRDDWQFLSSILEDKDQAVSLMLIHAAPLLRRIGEQVGE